MDTWIHGLIGQRCIEADSVLGTRERAVNKTDKVPTAQGV